MPSWLDVGYIASETSQRDKGHEKPLANFRGQSSSPKFYSYGFDFIVSVPTDQDKPYGARRPRLRPRSQKRRGARFSGSSTRLRKSPNACKISGMTPEELENKALTDPEAAAEAECHLIQNRDHIWDHSEQMADSHITWALEDQMANLSTTVALCTPREMLSA
jgi:hypothetical protein